MRIGRLLAGTMLAALAAAHSEVDAAATPVPHKIKHAHGVPILRTHLQPEELAYWLQYSTETYYTTPLTHRTALYMHMALYISSFAVLYPFVLVLWNLQHRLYFAALTAHVLLVCIAIINYWVFKASIKDLYPHNAYHTMLWLLFVGSIGHWLVALVAVALSYVHPPFQYEFLEENDSDVDELDKVDLEPPHVLPILRRFPLLQSVVAIGGGAAHAATSVCNWALFSYFLVYFPTMIATFGVYGLDGLMFNILAHFIKGGVFFVLGLVTLARYCGAFKNKGWAWNHRFVSHRAGARGWLAWQPEGLWTMEFIESFLILFYGCTNVFLEHLALKDGAWTAKDLQHVLIAFVFMGCGLCGCLVEYKLSAWRFSRAQCGTECGKATPGFSPNPFPILTIYWMGVLMLSHEQASPLLTQIHTQWGNMFVVGCAFRLLTYVMEMLVPAAKPVTEPRRPMTELIVSFALLCGGLIFMELCDPLVHTFEYYGFTLMFTLNVSLGFVALLMAWEMIVFAVKDWLATPARACTNV